MMPSLSLKSDCRACTCLRAFGHFGGRLNGARLLRTKVLTYGTASLTGSFGRVRDVAGQRFNFRYLRRLGTSDFPGRETLGLRQSWAKENAGGGVSEGIPARTRRIFPYIFPYRLAKDS